MMNIEIEPRITIDNTEELLEELNTISSIHIEDMDATGKAHMKIKFPIRCIGNLQLRNPTQCIGF